MASEALIAYEVGYRAQITDRFSWDIAMFYNVYSSLEGVVNAGILLEQFPQPGIWCGW